MSNHDDSNKDSRKPDEEMGLPPASAKDLKKYTHQIWLAGLGAFSRSEEDGKSFFDALVEAGKEVEAKTRDLSQTTHSRVREVRSRVKDRTGETLEKMERAFDDRLGSALSRLGIPNKREVDALNEKIRELTETIERLRNDKPDSDEA